MGENKLIQTVTKSLNEEKGISAENAAEIMELIMTGEVPKTQLASFLTALHTYGEKAMSRMRRCPTCGSRLKHEDYTKRIEKKRLSRDKLTLESIDDMFDGASLYFEINDLDKYSFLS